MSDTKVESKNKAEKLISPTFSSEQAFKAYNDLVLIREFEDKVHASFQAGLVHGTTHLCQGQEAISAGCIATLRDDDYLTYTYRGHGPCLARGMSIEGAFAEIFGRKTGVSGGLGGSMHLTDMELGLLGSFAIVGAGLPVAAGAAISAQADKKGQVSMTFFGDGSANIGGFHETMNLAAAWNLPLIFICENNLYGEYSPILSTTPTKELVVRASAYAMPGYSVDGNDVMDVYEKVNEAVERARDNGGPSFIECHTYRQCGHSRSDPAKYRPEGELDEWLAKDPIIRFRKNMISQNLATEDQLDDLHVKIKAQVDNAAEQAANAAWPEDKDLTEFTYVV